MYIYMCVYERERSRARQRVGVCLCLLVYSATLMTWALTPDALHCERTKLN